MSQPKQRGRYRNFAARSPLLDKVMKDEKKNCQNQKVDDSIIIKEVHDRGNKGTPPRDLIFQAWSSTVHHLPSLCVCQ